MKSLRSLFMQRCFFLVFLFMFLLVCNGFTLDKDYQSSEEKQEIDQLQEASNMGKREIIASICAISLFVTSTVTIIFSIIAVRKRHAVERKNRDLANQVAQATYYKTQYIKLQSEKETAASNDETNKKININEASTNELETLSGIGRSKAEAIVEYRKKNKFKTIEDIMNVDGIGENLFANIKESITV